VLQPKSRGQVPRGHGELILVVDDEAPARQAVKAALLDQGYTVLTASDGKEALALYGREGSNIRLVLTDLMMPGLDGIGLIRVLRGFDPNIRLIAMSGLLEGPLAPVTEGSDKLIFLQKPFTPEELLTRIHEMVSPRRDL
jgi:CheY-like chemotaxis protein